MGKSEIWRQPGVAALVILASGLIFTAISLPGEVSTDSLNQLSDARTGIISDWHSPILTVIWHGLLQIYDNPATMLLFQQSLYWGGAVLFAWSMHQVGRNGAAWAILAVALFPHFLFFNHYILKDTAQYSSMFLAAGLCLLVWISEGRSFSLRVGLCFVALYLAALTRINSAFAVAPFVVILLVPALALRAMYLIPAILVATVALVGAIRLTNSAVLQAESSDVEQSLQLFDLAGIHRFSHDEGVWGGNLVTTSEIEACYTPYYWDVFGKNSACAFIRARIGAGVQGDFDHDAATLRKSLWLSAISRHPGYYLLHRLNHFNSSIYFAVPALHARFNKAVRDGAEPGRRPFTQADVRFDFLKKSFLIWPVTWLVLETWLLVVLWPVVAKCRYSRFAVALAASGLAYGLGYFFIGVATDVRYFLWTNLSVFLALILGWPQLRNAWSGGSILRPALLTGLLVVFGVGIGARLLGVQIA